MARPLLRRLRLPHSATPRGPSGYDSHVFRNIMCELVCARRSTHTRRRGGRPPDGLPCDEYYISNKLAERESMRERGSGGVCSVCALYLSLAAREVRKLRAQSPRTDGGGARGARAPGATPRNRPTASAQDRSGVRTGIGIPTSSLSVDTSHVHRAVSPLRPAPEVSPGPSAARPAHVLAGFLSACVSQSSPS